MRQGLRTRTKQWVVISLGLLLLSGCFGPGNQASTPASGAGTQGTSGFVAPPITGMGTVTGVVPAAAIPRVASGTAARITSQQGGLWLTPDAVLAAVQADAQARKTGDTLQPPLTRAQQIPINPSGQYNLSVPGGTGYELVYIDAQGNGVQIANINVPVGATKQIDVANTQLQPTGSVVMTVVDRATAQPINNATVTLINTGTQILSDATGVAEIQNLPPGHYAVTVAQTGYLSRYVYFQVASGQPTNLQNIELGTDKGGASGQVLATGLSSLENIVVYAKGSDGSVTSTLTSSAGIFQFPALAVGQGYSFVASAEGFVTAKMDGVNIVKGSTAAVPTLPLVRQTSSSKGAISGFARFGERAGLMDHAGILVSVEGSDLAAVTARDGSFVLNNIPVGTPTINFTDSNHATLTRVVTIQGGSTVKMTEINLAAVTGAIGGSVTGAGGAPLAGVAVSDDLGNATVTDPSGAFTLSNIPVGDRVVTLQTAGYLPATATVTVASGVTTPVAAAPVAMSPMTLSGRVLLSNGASDHSGTTVTLQGGTLAANLTTTTDATGAFTLFGVGPGSYQILTTRPGFVGKTTPVAVLGQSANYQVTFAISMDPAIGVVKGRVILPNAPDNSGVTVALGGQTTTTDVVGQWFLNLPEGSYSAGINYTHPDYVGQSDPAAITVAAATPVDKGSITLTRNTGSIGGSVTDGAIPLAGVSVTDDLGNTTVTNGSGAFTLATVAVGTRTLTVIKSGFSAGTASVTVTAGATANLAAPVALTALTLTGTVNLSGATDHSGVALTLAGSGGINLTTTSNVTGQYTFGGVPDGSYQIQASKTGYSTKQLPVAVVGNSSAYAIPFALALDPAIGVVKGRVILPNAPDNSGVVVALGGQTTTTDVVGQWYLNLPEGSYGSGINYSHPDYVGQSDAAAISVAAATPVDKGSVTLTRNTGSIGGSVSDGAVPLAGVNVTDDLGNTTVTNASGAFTLATVAVGTRTLTALKEGFAAGTATTTVTAGATANLATPMALTALQLTGTVSLGAGALDHSGVTLTLAGAGGINLTTTSNAAGQYTFSGVPDGSYQIQASKTGFTTKQLPVSVFNNQATYAIPFALTLDPAIGVVKGRVILPNAADNSGVTVALGGQTTTTDVVGQWYLNLPEGSYGSGINYTHPDYVGQGDTAIVAVSTAAPVDKGTVTLTRNTGSITGVVNDGAAALAGTSVTDDLGNTTTTNASGIFTLANVAVGTRTLTVLKSGFTAGGVGVTVTAGATATLAAPVSLTALQLTGTVSLGGSAPDNSGVTLTLAGPGGINLTTTSNGLGAFTFSGVPDGSYQIQASKTGYATKQLPVAVVGNSGAYAIPFALILDPAIGVVKGRVVLPNAADNSGVTVALGGQTTTTDVVGQWYLNLPEGSYAGGINYTHPDYVGQSDPAAVAVAAASPVDKGSVTLTRNTGTLTGVVTDGATPLVGASVTDDLGNTTVTNASGVFTLATVAVGTRTLSVIKGGFTAGGASATVTAGATADLSGTPIILTQRTLTGTVTATVGGGAIVGATVSIAGGASASSDAAGQYTLAGVDPGTYLLWVSAPGYVSRSVVAVIPNQAASTAPAATLDTAYGTLQGRIALSLGSAADYGFVSVTVKDGAGAVTLATATPDATGAWGVNVQTGSGHQVVVAHPDYAAASKTGLNVAVGQVTDTGLLTLTRNTGTITGTVVDGASAPLVGATLVDDLGNQATSGAGGSFTLTSPVGTRTLNVSLSGYTAPTAAVTAAVTHGAATSVGNIALTQRTLSGAVTATTGGASLSGVVVTVASSGATATTDALGAYAFNGLNPGTYALSFAKTGYATRSLTVVVPDQTATTAPTLAMDTAYGTLQGRVSLAKGSATDYAAASVTVKNSAGTTTLATAIPDATGVWATNVQAGSAYQIAVTHADYAAGSKTGLTVTASQTTDTGLLTLTRNTGTITGLVQNGATPLAGVSVADDLGNAATTNASGVFTLSSPVGSRTLTAIKSGFTTGVAAATVTTGATTDLSATPIALTALTLTGTVNLGGGAVNHSGVTLTLSGGGGINLTTTSNAVGAFTFSGVVDGAYQIQASKTGFVTQTRTITVLNNTGTFTAPGAIVLDPAIGSVVGRVVLPGAADNSGVLVSLGGQTTTTDPVGQWALNLPEGSYTGGIGYSHADYVGQSDAATVAVSAATPVDKGVVTLVAKTVSLSGAVSPATASVSDGLGHTTTAVAGSFTLAGVSAGQRTLTVTAPGYLSQTVAVTVNVDPVTSLAITTPGVLNVALTQRALSGAVAMANGTSTAGVVVSLSGAPGTYSGSVVHDPISNTGALLVANIEPGNYNLTLSQSGFVAQTIPVSIVDGVATYTLPGTITLQAATGTLTGRVVLPNATENGGVVVTATGPAGSYTTTTDPTGVWLLTLPEGNIESVQYGHADYVTQNDAAVSVGTPAVIASNSPVDLGSTSLTAKAVSISGVVTPATATVSDGLGHTSTAVAGAFTVANVPTGTRTLTVTAPGYLGQAVTVTVSVDPVSGLAVTTPAAINVVLTQRALTGSVAMANGTTTAGMVVSLSGSAGTYTGSVTNGAGNIGTLSVAGIEPGNYNLTLSQAGFVTQTIPVSIVDGVATYTLPGTITLAAATGTLTGRVVLPNAVENGGVVVTATGPAGSVTTTTDPTGVWLLILPEGSVTSVQYGHSDYVTLADAAVSAGTPAVIASATPVDLGTSSMTAKAVSVSGTVSPSGATVSDGLGHTALASAGAFTVTGVPTGTRTLTVSAPGYLSQALTVSVSVDPGTGATVTSPAAINVTLTQRMLTGTVAMADGSTTAAVSAMLSGSAGSYLGTVTNGVGNIGVVNVAGIEPGNYNLTLSQSGFVTQTIPVAVVDGIVTYAVPGTVTLQAAKGTLSGYVVLSGQNDHSGVTVTASGVAATSDVSGYWQLDVQAGSVASVTFAKTGFLTANDTSGYLVANAATTRVGIRTLLPATGSIAGSVVDDLGAPIANATIVVSTALGSATAISAGNGTFTVTGVPVSTNATLTVAAGHHASASQTAITVTSGATTTLGAPIALSRLTLTGTAMLLGASDYSPISLQLLGTAIPNATINAVTGAFSFFGVGSGSYQLQVGAPGYVTQTIPVTILVDQNYALLSPITLARNQGVLSGVATKSGATDHSGILVTLTDTNTNSYTTVTNALGQWQKTVPAANYTQIDYSLADYIAVADTAGYNLSQGDQLTATTQTLTLNAGTVAVTTDDGTNKLGAVDVTLQSANHTYTATTATDGTGQVAITGVIAGTYTLSAQKSGYGNAQVANVVVTTAGTTQTLSLAVNQLSGTLNLEEGSDHSGVTVSLKDQTGTTLGNTTSAVDGSFTLNGVTAGNYRLVLTPASADYTSRTINVTIVGNEGLVLVETIALSKTNFAYDRDHLTFATIQGQNDTAASIRYNLNLPTVLTRGTAVTWSSNQPGLIDASGVVTLPLSTDTPAVTLTATDSATSATVKSFSLVLAVDYAPKFDLGSSAIWNLNEDFGVGYRTLAAHNANGEAITYAIENVVYTFVSDPAAPSLFSDYAIDAVTGELRLDSAANLHGLATLTISATTVDQVATVALTVEVAAVADPIAVDLQAPSSVALGQTVLLDASNTNDVDGDAQYNWQITAQPVGSTQSLSGTEQTIGFTPSISGTYSILLTASNGAGTPSTSVDVKVLPSLKIVENPATPTISVGNIAVTEGSNAVFYVSIADHPNDPVVFDYVTSDGSARVDLDYQRVRGSQVSIPPGLASTHQITVPISVDQLPEADETFFLNIVNLQGAFESNVEAQGTITYEPLDLNVLTGVNGAKVPMTTAGYWDDRPIAGVGDVNGDGYDDFAVSESTFNGYQGRVFVVFGKPGLGVYGAVDVAAMTPGSDYIVITHGSYGRLGAAIAGADIDQDGYSDIIVGAPYASVVGSYGGGIYVIYGSASPVDVDISSATGVTKIGRTTASAYMANNIRVVGDVNGDGYPDLLIGKNAQSDRAYLVYGGHLSTTTPIDLDAISGTGQGIQLNVASSTSLGSDLSAAGDVNGDGYADFMIGENTAIAASGSYAGKVYLVYGAPTLPGTIDLTTSAGVTISGAYYNWSGDALSHGDINGDGYSDLLIGGRYGSSWQGDVAAIWGGPALEAVGTIDLATDLYATGLGVRYVGDHGGSLSYFGQGMASPGDLNADGFDDIVVGAPGSDAVAANVGEVFVFYGGASLPGVSYASGLDGSNGYAITGQVLLPKIGTYVTSTGDVNGDGYPDVAFSNESRSVNYLVYGNNLTNQITHLVAANETRAGTAGRDVMKGAGGNETLIGGGGNDVITGGPGGDVIHVTGTDFARVDGGAGLDRLVFDQADTILDLTALRPEQIRGIEIIDFGGTAANQVVLDANTARWLNRQSDRGVVIVAAGADDKIDFGAESWSASTAGATTTPAGLIGDLGTQYGMPQGANQLSLGDVSLWVDAHMPTYPSIVVQDVAVNEDKGEVRIRVARDNGLYVSSVQYATTDGTALDGTHYTGQSGTLTFYLGELVHEVVVPLVKDPQFEPDAQFTLDLSSPSNAIVATASGTVTIHDNTIDLTQLDPEKVSTLDASSGWYPIGYAVGTAGDLNADGFEDFVVTGGYGAGYRANIVFGQANAAKTLAALDLATPDGTTTVAIDGLLSYGLSFSPSCGDFNGDGYDDVLIGDPFFSVGGFGTNTYEGQVLVIYGQPHVAGVSTIGTAGVLNVTTMTAADGVTFSGALAQDRLGQSVAFAGDMNGDGWDDIVTGTPFVDVGPNADAGRANIIFGAASPSSAALSAANSIELYGASINNGQFGVSVATAGDVNGDGYADAVIGAQYENVFHGKVYLVQGGAALAPGVTPTVRTILPETYSFYFGISVAGGGDINGDGYSDLVIGASSAQTTIGMTLYLGGGCVDVVYGSATFASLDLSTTPLDGTNGFTILGSTLNGAAMTLGDKVAMVGDINGDGRDDIAMGSSLYTTGLDQVSMLYGGSVAGATLDVTQITPSQGFTVQGTFPDEDLGSAIVGGTDWNGDGFADLLLGARGYALGNSTVGRAYLIYGNDFSGIRNYYGTSGNDGNSGGISGSAYYYLLQGNDTGNVVTAPDFIFGGQGDDKILINAGSIDTVAFYAAGVPTGKYVGGRGLDSLEFYYGTGTVDFTAANKLPNTFTGFEMINLRKVGEPTGINSNETIVINATRMRQMMDSDRHTFWIRGDVSDAAVVSGGPWTEVVLDGDPLYNTYTWNGGNLTLKVDSQMVVGGKLTLN